MMSFLKPIFLLSQLFHVVFQFLLHFYLIYGLTSTNSAFQSCSGFSDLVVVLSGCEAKCGARWLLAEACTAIADSDFRCETKSISKSRHKSTHLESACHSRCLNDWHSFASNCSSGTVVETIIYLIKLSALKHETVRWEKSDFNALWERDRAMNAKCKCFRCVGVWRRRANKKKVRKRFLSETVVSESFLAVLWLAFKRRFKISSVKCLVFSRRKNIFMATTVIVIAAPSWSVPRASVWKTVLSSRVVCQLRTQRNQNKQKKSAKIKVCETPPAKNKRVYHVA